MNFYFGGLPGSPREWERKWFQSLGDAVSYATMVGWTFVFDELKVEPNVLEIREVWSLFDGEST